MPKNPETNYDVVVVGAGAGGICAALASARTGAKTLLIERSETIGGTGVHSPVSLICKFHGSDHRPINLGIHRELFPHAYLHSTRDKRPGAKRLTYDEKELAQTYERLVAAESKLSVITGTGVTEAIREGSRIERLRLEDGSEVSAPCFVDSTADGNLADMAGCPSEKGRSTDGSLQSATLTFTLGNIDKSKLKVPRFDTRGSLESFWAEMKPIYKEAQARGETINPKSSVVCFPYPDGERMLFNANEVVGVDPTVPGSVEAGRKKAEQMVHELITILRRHPALKDATVDFVSTWLGVREGRRITGDYVLTEEDCLGEARFEDMLAACAYEIDIHDPSGKSTRMVDIPGSGYYHIPYRSLIAANAENLLLGSRCISGTHEAHSSYRVISGVTAIGQAAGTAAALAARYTEGKTRAIPASWSRYVLREQVQFVEGSTEAPPDWDSPTAG